MSEKKRRISWMDRLVIEKLYNSGHSYREISNRLGFAISSVYQEIQRGLYPHLGAECTRRPNHYSAQIAEDDAHWQATSRGGIIKLGNNHAYAKAVSVRLRSGESPDQITGSMKRKGEWTVSTSTLYRYIDQGFIPDVTNKNLWMKSRKKRSYNKIQKAARPPRGTSIERRPPEIAARLEPSHWEMDSVIGKQKGTGQSILVLTERMTRYEIIIKLQDKTASSVVRALEKVVSNFPQGTFKTITVDNGSEFADCLGMEQAGAKLYYCHPFCSSERGSNENANKIIRRFFPKRESLANRTQRDCDAVADYMNNMHRKILGYATAAELFNQWQETLR